IAGYAETFPYSSFVCWQLLADGTADNSFGSNGMLTLASGKWTNLGWFVLPLEEGFVAGGDVYNGASDDILIYKILPNGTLDSTYGSNGVSGKTFVVSDPPVYAAIDSDENIFFCAAGISNGNSNITISKILSNGEIDTAFSLDGKLILFVSEPVPTSNWIDDFILLPDSSIFITGAINAQMAFMKLFNNGSIDSSYGINGFLIPETQRNNEWPHLAGKDSFIYVVDGFQHVFYSVYHSFYYDPSPPDSTEFAVHKIQTNGMPDLSFGVNGIAEVAFPGFTLTKPYAIAVQPEGKLLITGLLSYGQPQYYATDVYIIRLHPDGTPDISWGDQGIMIFDWNIYDNSPKITTYQDGKILIAAIVYDTIGSHTTIQRLLPDGTSDLTFGNNSLIMLANNQYTREMLIQPDGKIIISATEYSSDTLIVMRLQQDGVVDSSFGTLGKTSFNPYISVSFPMMDLQNDGKIVFASRVVVGGAPYTYPIAVGRFDENGFLDETFATNGVIELEENTSLGSIHLQEDGKILVGGGSAQDFFMARLLNDVTSNIEDDFVLQQTLNVFPNPVSDQLILQTSFSPGKEASIIITNSIGQIMKQEPVRFTGDKIKVNVKDFPTGIYLITLKSSAELSSAKFVKE
nr:T9SS type A sorting domain-containing protein [Chitinophagales bacterium]